MERNKFKERMKQYRLAREENPGLKYWEWKAIPKYEDDTGNVQSANIPLWRQKATPELLEAFWTGDTQKMADIAEKQNQQITYASPEYTLDEVVVTAKDPNKYTELDLAKDVAGFTPVIGDAMDIYDLVKSVYNGNYAQAAMLGAGLLLPNWLEKFGKTLYKAFSRPNLEFYAKLVDDVTLRPKETYSAYKKGLYPLTFKQRRKYLKQVHEFDDKFRKILLQAIQDDLARRLTIYPNEPFVGNRDYWVTTKYPEENINSLSTVNSRSYWNFNNPYKTSGTNHNSYSINSHASLRKSGDTNILNSPESVAGTLVHERQHSVTNNFPEFSYLFEFSPEAGYYVPTESVIPPKDVVNIFSKLNKNIINGNAWNSSPAEWFSNAMEYRVRFVNGKPYRELSEQDRNGFIDWMHTLHGTNLSRDEIQRMLFESSIRGFSDGGQVQSDTIDPVDMFNRTRYQVNGIPANDQPLSGTDPVGEAVIWGLGGGAASAALRKLFPIYGPMAAWLAFGEKGKDNMLVVPNNKSAYTTPISKGNVNKEVQQYFADDVLPRDIIYSDKMKQDFMTNDNFTYDVYDPVHFNDGVAGYYDKTNKSVAINPRYASNKERLDDVVAHEVNHRYNEQYPLDKEHNEILNRAYTVSPNDASKAARAAKRDSEKRATNTNIRHALYADAKKKLGRNPNVDDINEYIDSISDNELFDRLRMANSYGGAYLLSIEERAELNKQPIDQYKKARATALRKALKRIAMTESNQEQNYA